MTEIRFLAIAQQELEEAVGYYNSEAEGLGERFLLEVLEAMESIRQHPDAWTWFTPNTRRRQLRRFPYGIVYSATQDQILIVAVMNLHREPNYWIGRL